MTNILLAVNDTPAGLAAARAAVRWAKRSDASLRALHVLPDWAPLPSQPGRPTGGVGDGATREEAAARRALGSAAVLQHVAELARREGVAVETVAMTGSPARAILGQASSWPADLIVLGRSGVRHVGQPFVGSQVLNVLEFAEVPVLVVPPPP
jgi:nucleotide-binding universal stress UspA family protein